MVAYLETMSILAWYHMSLVRDNEYTGWVSYEKLETMSILTGYHMSLIKDNEYTGWVSYEPS